MCSKKLTDLISNFFMLMLITNCFLYVQLKNEAKEIIKCTEISFAVINVQVYQMKAVTALFM